MEGSEESWSSASQGQWEPETFQILQAFLTPESVQVDIGAWIGVTTLFGATCAKRVLAFEPDPKAHAELVRNLSLNPALAAKVQVVQAAVSTENTTQPLYCRWDFGDSGSSLLSRIKARGPAIEVVTRSLESVLEEYGIAKIDFVKMDIEGGEFGVLPSILAYLQQQRPVLYVSFHLDALAESLVRVETPNRLAVKAGNLTGKLGWNPSVNKARAAGLKRLRDAIEALSFYPYIYSAEGQQLSPEHLMSDLESVGNEALLFTNQPWPQ